MNEVLVSPEVLEETLSEALSRGGEFAEVFVEDRSVSTAQWDQSRVEELRSGRDRGAGVRVIVGGTTGFAYTADLGERSLRDAARAASAVARSGAGENRRVDFRDVRSYTTTAREGFANVERARKVELLRRADDVARSVSPSISQVQVTLGESTRRFVVANSNGVLATDHQVRTRLAVACVASGDTGLQTGYRTLAQTRGYEILDDGVEDVANRAAQNAVTKLSARPAPSGDFAVVLAGGSGGILFHEACGHGLEADAIAKGASLYAGRVGERVASPLVTLVDDGTVEGEWGYLAIDDEGNPGSRNVLIQDGVLREYMWDYLRARDGGRPASANGRRQSYQHLPMVRMTNTYLLPGDDDAEEIVAQTPYGVYVAQLGGGQVNTTTGDFVFGTTSAFLIENGRITSPLRDCNLIGNGPEILGRVDAIAQDFSMTPGTCGKNGQQVPVGCGQATMRLSRMTVGGAA